MITRKVISIPIRAGDAIACSPVDRTKILPLYTSYTQTEPSDNHWFPRPPLDLRARRGDVIAGQEGQNLNVGRG
jgi:hypothetical protein